MIKTLFLTGLVASIASGAMRPETTIVRGRVAIAITGQPVANAIVKVGGDSVLTDTGGHYELRASRASDWLGIRKEGFLDFQHPLIELTADTLIANVELRTDPPSAASYLGQPVLPFLCVRMDDPRHLDVTNSCQWPTYPAGDYVRKIIKHNPWNPYFGRAGDHGGIMLATRSR